MPESDDPLAVLVTGTRHGLYPAWSPVVRTRFRFIGPIDVLIHGDAPGIDTIAARVADELGCPRIIAYPAHWGELGRSAGPIRNKKMLNRLLRFRFVDGHRIRVEGFHHDYLNALGTRNMAEMAVQCSLDLADPFPVTMTNPKGVPVDLVALRQTLAKQRDEQDEKMRELFR